MNPEVFAEWWRRQGHKVRRTTSSYWVEMSARVWQAFPYHWLIRPTEEELDQFLRQERAVALRYSTFLDSPLGCLSYHAVLTDSTYDLNALGKKARYDVRLGLKNCEVHPISFAQLAEEGWHLQRDTLDRQHRQETTAYLSWRLLCEKAEQLPGFLAWGALLNGRLIASLITFRMQDCGYILSQQSLREYLSLRSNNALSFVVTKTMLSQPGINSIFYGLHSLDAPPSVDEFKFRLGYTAKPVRQRVVFHPWLRFLVNRGSHGLVRRLLRLHPGNPTLAKAEGLMRFYLEGRRPLEEQRLPAGLQRSANDPESHQFVGDR